VEIGVPVNLRILLPELALDGFGLPVVPGGVVGDEQLPANLSGVGVLGLGRVSEVESLDVEGSTVEDVSDLRIVWQGDHGFAVESCDPVSEICEADSWLSVVVSNFWCFDGLVGWVDEEEAALAVVL
jgi:hypothetical protein